MTDGTGSFDETVAAQASDGLEATVAAKRDDSVSPPSAQPGDLIGRYVVLAKLGAGAMGVVMAAYDPELDRKVALKLLKPRGGDRSAAQTRLQREAQALAKLDHPNVVGVHDVGLHGGRLFVGMEFVEGTTLGDWIEAHEAPRPWPEVLALFADAGRGLAAAHQAGLVHRDFKPDNVMVGADGRVRVMDFGLARAGEDLGPAVEIPATESAIRDIPSGALLDTPLTQTGTMMGTPAYMSPEQFRRGSVDARSDQFAFCVSLYEALYGERPFEGKTMVALAFAVTNGKFRPIPKGSNVPGWVRRVVLRGLCVDPDERWPSMDALLDALADDPAVRRRQWGVGLALAGVMIGGGVGLYRTAQTDAGACTGAEDRVAAVWDDAQRSRIRAALVRAASGYGEETGDRVVAGFDAYTSAWADARTEACQATRRGEQSGELLDLRMTCLDERLERVEALVDVLAEADGSVATKAVSAVAALPGLERCADPEALRARQPPPDDPKVAARVDELDRELGRAVTLENTGQYDDAFAIASATLEEATELGYEPLQAQAGLHVGELEQQRGNYEAAVKAQEDALAIAIALHMDEEAAILASNLVHVVGTEMEQREPARLWAKVAVPLVRAARLPRASANLETSLGNLESGTGNYDAAKTHHEKALELWGAATGPDDPAVAGALMNLATTAMRSGDYDASRDYSLRALEIQKRALGPTHPDVAAGLGNLAIAAYSAGRYEDALGYAEEAVEIAERALGTDHPTVGDLLGNVGITLSALRRYDEARTVQTRALEIFEKTYGSDHPKVGFSFTSLGTIASRVGDYDASQGYHERALEIWRKSLPEGHPYFGVTLSNLGTVARRRGRYAEARAYFEDAIEIKEKKLGPDHPTLSSAVLGLGISYLDDGKPVEALPHIERGVALFEKGKKDDELGLAEYRFELARALWDAPAERGGDRARAVELAQSSKVALAKGGDKVTEELARVEEWLTAHTQSLASVR